MITATPAPVIVTVVPLIVATAGVPLVNTTGWVELPKSVYDTSMEDNAFAGLTLGLAKGLGMTLVRTGSGIFEIATFPFPLPEDYKPILEPEYVF